MSLFARLYDTGIPGNLIASAISAMLGYIVGHHFFWIGHMRPHIDRTQDIHRHLDPNDPFTIGGSLTPVALIVQTDDTVAGRPMESAIPPEVGEHPGP